MNHRVSMSNRTGNKKSDEKAVCEKSELGVFAQRPCPLGSWLPVPRCSSKREKRATDQVCHYPKRRCHLRSAQNQDDGALCQRVARRFFDPHPSNGVPMYPRPYQSDHLRQAETATFDPAPQPHSRRPVSTIVQPACYVWQALHQILLLKTKTASIAVSCLGSRQGSINRRIATASNGTSSFSNDEKI